MTHDLLALPDSPLAREVLDLVNRCLPPAIRNHSLRSFVFARLVAVHRELQPGRDYDLDLLLCACALHDVGLGAGRGTGQRFEVASADIAAELLTRRGAPAAAVDASGGSGFAAVSVPAAAVRLAQGVGRLIRSRRDMLRASHARPHSPARRSAAAAREAAR